MRDPAKTFRGTVPLFPTLGDQGSASYGLHWRIDDKDKKRAASCGASSVTVEQCLSCFGHGLNLVLQRSYSILALCTQPSLAPSDLVLISISYVALEVPQIKSVTFPGTSDLPRIVLPAISSLFHPRATACHALVTITSFPCPY